MALVALDEVSGDVVDLANAAVLAEVDEGVEVETTSPLRPRGATNDRQVVDMANEQRAKPAGVVDVTSDAWRLRLPAATTADHSAASETSLSTMPSFLTPPRSVFVEFDALSSTTMVRPSTDRGPTSGRPGPDRWPVCPDRLPS